MHRPEKGGVMRQDTGFDGGKGGGGQATEVFDASLPLEEWPTEELRKSYDHFNNEDHTKYIPKDGTKKVERKVKGKVVQVELPDRSGIEEASLSDIVGSMKLGSKWKEGIRKVLIERGEFPQEQVSESETKGKGVLRKLAEKFGGERVKRKFEAKDVEETIVGDEEYERKNKSAKDLTERSGIINGLEKKRDQCVLEAKKIGRAKADAQEAFNLKLELLGQRPHPDAKRILADSLATDLKKLEAREESIRKVYDDVDLKLGDEYKRLDQTRKTIVGASEHLRGVVDVEVKNIETVTNFESHKAKEALLLAKIDALKADVAEKDNQIKGIGAIIESQGKLVAKDEKKKYKELIGKLENQVKRIESDIEATEKDLDVVNGYLIAIELRTANVKALASKLGFEEGSDPEAREKEEINFELLFSPPAKEKEKVVADAATAPTRQKATTSAGTPIRVNSGGGFERQTLAARQERSKERKKGGMFSWFTRLFGGPESPEEDKALEKKTATKNKERSKKGADKDNY